MFYYTENRPNDAITLFLYVLRQERYLQIVFLVCPESINEPINMYMYITPAKGQAESHGESDVHCE